MIHKIDYIDININSKLKIFSELKSFLYSLMKNINNINLNNKINKIFLKIISMKTKKIF